MKEAEVRKTHVSVTLPVTLWTLLNGHVTRYQGGKQLYSAISRSPTNCALFAWYALFATHKASYSIHYTIIRSADDYRLYSLKCLPLLCLALQQRMFTVLYIAWRAPRDKKHPCDKTPHVA